MKNQFLEGITILQTCKRCLLKSKSPDHVINDKASIEHCISKCERCLDEEAVCTECLLAQQTSHLPPLRACANCLEDGVQCIRACVLVLTSDCESGNKTAFELIIDDFESHRLSPEYIFSCLSNAVHVGKTLKASFANCMLLLDGERACLSVLHCLCDEDATIRRVLPRDAVLNKDRMDVDCILHLTKDVVLEELKKIGRVVHPILPDRYKVTDSNRSGLYPHPIAISMGNHSKLLVLDYKPMCQTTRLLEVRLHSPADVKVIKELGDARHIVYLEGIAYVSASSGIYVVPISGQISPSANELKKSDLKKILQQWKVPAEGTVVQLRKRLNDQVKKRLTEHQKAGIDTNKIILSEDIQPSCICSMLELESDGAAMHGSVEELCHYLDECSQSYLCV